MFRPGDVQPLQSRVRNSESVLVADLLLEVDLENGTRGLKKRLVETLVNPLALRIRAVSVTCTPQWNLGNSKVPTIRTARCVHVGMGCLEAHMGHVALSEVKLAQSPAY